MRRLEEERVRALGALRSFQSKEKLAVEKQWETHLLRNNEKQKLIEHDVDRETAVATKRVEDAETSIQQVQEDMRNVEKARLTTRQPGKTLIMFNAAGDRLSDLASSDNQEDGQDEDYDEEDTEPDKLSQDGKPGWVMGTISKMVQQHIDSVQQNQVRLDKLTPQWCRDAADYFCKRDMKYGMAAYNSPAVVELQTDKVIAAPTSWPFGESIQRFDILPM